jgi:predicted metal-binding membrane protein
VIAAIAVAWAVAVLAEVTGTAGALHHDALNEGGPPLWAALLLFLLAWQAMIAAMMLALEPAVDPAVRGGERETGAPDPGARAAFLGGYAAVWTGFGAVAFLGDVSLHHTVHAVPWLDARPWLIGGAVLALAGAFQISDIKDKCLSKCRQPGPYLMAHYRRGAEGAFRLGSGHGLFCLGCCWALMVNMFAAGAAMLWWMVALTAVMVYEKTGRHGEAATRVVGVALFGLAVVAFLHTPWFPTLFAH